MGTIVDTSKFYILIDKYLAMESDVPQGDVLIPREDLVSKACEFLQHPKVINTSLAQRKAFLVQKGLTDEEVSLAVQRSGALKEPVGGAAASSSQNVAASLPQPLLPAHSRVAGPTLFSRIYDAAALCLMLGGISYGVYTMLRKYILPIWLGPTEEERQLQALKASLSELESSIQQLVEGISGVQESITKQASTVTQLSLNQAALRSQDTLKRVGETNGLQDIKTEITSLKGLLLNRNQFPKTPRTQPVLPSWQLTQDTEPTQECAAADSKDESVGESVVCAVKSDTACSLPDTADNMVDVAQSSSSFEMLGDSSSLEQENMYDRTRNKDLSHGITSSVSAGQISSSSLDTLTSPGEASTEHKETLTE